MRRGFQRAAAGIKRSLWWVPLAVALLLVLAVGAGCAGAEAAEVGPPPASKPESSAPGTMPSEASPAGAAARPQATGSVGAVETRSGPAPAVPAVGARAAVIGSPGFATAVVPAAAVSNVPRDVSGLDLFGGRSGGQATLTIGGEATVEELLESGLRLAGASPVHLAIRGTAASSSIRCDWRGIARTASQREDAIRFWLRLDEDAAIPSAAFLETLFTVFLDTLDPEYRETAKSNFLAIARGGLSTEYLFLACYADYTVSSYLLGAGPNKVTVAYDGMGEARSYELYRREHEAGQFGEEALQTRGEYEAGLQETVIGAEQELVDDIGSRESVVFLAPMGAHHAIAVEAWQAVAQWDVVTADDDTVNAVRVGIPQDDPEYSQTLANLTARITAATTSDPSDTSTTTTTRIANVSGLQAHYRSMGAYGDITPGDGATTTFTPAQPPAAPTCTNGTVVTTPDDNRGLVRDCEVLLAAKTALAGTATLDWATSTAVSSWEGIMTGGTPSRVTGLNLSSKSLTGTIPAGLGNLFELTSLNLSTNQLTGDIPRELGWLTNLTELRLSGNTLTGCIPLVLKSVATNDLSSLNLLYCEPPAPVNLSAGTPGERSVVLNWDAVTNASKYRVEYRVGDPAAWTTDSDTITGTTHTVDELQCETSYELRVSAYGSGTTYAAAWGEPSAVFTTATGACTPPVFGAESYDFTIAENAAVDTPVGTVTATDGGGGAVTYAIAEDDEAEAFAINESSGAITVAAALDYETTSSYTLTVAASDAAGGTATVPVAIAVTDSTTDYDADDDGLIEVADLAQLHAMRWDLDGDGTSSDAGYATAFLDAPVGMGCPATGCTGYELTVDLDFDTDGSGAVDAADAYWNEGAGWEPVGTSAAQFTATFDGNGHVIANLFINRSSDQVGLFGTASGTLRHVGLTGVAVTGGNFVGGLVGLNEGRITGSYVSGRVTGTGIETGGLVGWNTGRITASYATAAVTGGGLDAGGLAGGNAVYAQITASYASGAVTGTGRAGGLVGFNGGRITASYARGGGDGHGGTHRRAGGIQTWAGHGQLLGHGDERAEHQRWGHGQDDQRAADAHGVQRHLRRLERGCRRRERQRRPVGLRHGQPVSGAQGGRRRQRHGDVGRVRGPAPSLKQPAGVHGRRDDHAGGGREHGGGGGHRHAGGGDRRGRRHADLHPGRDERGRLRPRHGHRAAADPGGAGLRGEGRIRSHHHGQRRRGRQREHHGDDQRGRRGGHADVCRPALRVPSQRGR